MPQPRPSTIASRPAGLRIVVVEDQPDSREMLAEILFMTGEHDIAVAQDAAEGLQALRQCACDLLVTDIGLPRVSGLEMLDLAQHEGLLAGTSVVVCSAHQEMKNQVVARGASFIPKPVALERLWHVVDERLDAPRPGRDQA